MESMDRILNQIKMGTTTSRNTVKKYKCNICKDTGWVVGDNGAYKRCSCYEMDHVQRLWKHFGVNPRDVKKLSEFKPYDPLTKSAKEKAVDYIKSFDQIRSTRKNSFGLFGQPGSGKTHLVICIGSALLTRPDHVPVVYMPYLEAMRELKANVNDDEYYLRLSRRYCSAKVLIIDDMFKDKVRNGQLVSKLNEADIKHILPIINYRYLNFLPTIYSSECTPAMLLDLDEATAGRIIEPCEDHMIIFKDKKYNYRMRNFMKG